MAIPSGLMVYTINSSTPVIAQAFSYSQEQLDIMLTGDVKEILLDSTGKKELHSLLGSLATTDFAQTQLTELLQEDIQFEDWLVGEAIAEAFTITKDQCEYPWPTSRDLKNSNASPAGCDLTGFQLTNNASAPYRFSFGEVKTSYDKNTPPSVMTSLGKQLFGLRDDKKIRDDLMRYLARHVTGSTWLEKFQSATTRYLQSSGQDIAIYGILVRDTTVSETDIKGKAEALAVNCPNQTNIALYALYLPQNTIQKLSIQADLAINAGENS